MRHVLKKYIILLQQFKKMEDNMIFTCQDILDFCISARNKRDANFSNFKKVLLEEMKKKHMENIPEVLKF